jgi:hypothetical protein
MAASALLDLPDTLFLSYPPSANWRLSLTTVRSAWRSWRST